MSATNELSYSAVLSKRGSTSKKKNPPRELSEQERKAAQANTFKQKQAHAEGKQKRKEARERIKNGNQTQAERNMDLKLVRTKNKEGLLSKQQAKVEEPLLRKIISGSEEFRGNGSSGNEEGDRERRSNHKQGDAFSTDREDWKPHDVDWTNYKPKNSEPQENVYVLSLLTDRGHHKRMTDFRRKYFPYKKNKTTAHLTLFHALPESKLESSVIPSIENIVAATQPFKVRATDAFRLKYGFGTHISHSRGGRQAEDIHRYLQDAWKPEGWLSTQDSGGSRVHYTIMNKGDSEEEVQNAWERFTAEWSEDEGIVEGLGLWKYDKGHWQFYRRFNFRPRREAQREGRVDESTQDSTQLTSEGGPVQSSIRPPRGPDRTRHSYRPQLDAYGKDKVYG